LTSLHFLLNSLPLWLNLRVPNTDAEITGLALDSRAVKPGDLFFALSGISTDGHQYIGQAIDNGAVAVVGSKALTQPLKVPYLLSENTRQALAWFSAAYYGFPARHLIVIGVTGTDGKTTTTNLIYQILKAAGLKVGLVSTVNAQIGDETIDTGFHVTTPEAPEIQRLLARMLTAGLTHVVLETTSHGLAQHRVDGCEYDIGVVTNITHEHLDYHGDYSGYLQAKARLLTSLAKTSPKQSGNPRLAVLNADDISYPHLMKILSQSEYKGIHHATYGSDIESDFAFLKLDSNPEGLRLRILHDYIETEINSPLIGEYNLANVAAAFTTAVRGLGIDTQIAAKGISQLRGISGRMERINLGQSFTAIVDFAHTPNALNVALRSARAMTKGRVIAVFGSAGLRDKQKRRMMAEVSAELADITILTAEDPRTESLADILKEMVGAAEAKGAESGRNLYSIEDRGDAIRKAVLLAEPGDLVIACGKGHEQSMCFGTTEYAWDDRIALRAAVEEIMGLKETEMPVLPTAEVFRT